MSTNRAALTHHTQIHGGGKAWVAIMHMGRRHETVRMGYDADARRGFGEGWRRALCTASAPHWTAYPICSNGSPWGDTHQIGDAHKTARWNAVQYSCRYHLKIPAKHVVLMVDFRPLRQSMAQTSPRRAGCRRSGQLRSDMQISKAGCEQ